MIAGMLFFVFCSCLCVFGALLVVLARNPIRGAMGLLATIVGIAGLFIRLNAEFLAAIQLLVYAGAVVILFVFVVMLLGTDASLKEDTLGGAKISRAVSGVLVVLLALAGMILFSVPSWHESTAVGASYGTVERVGRSLFTEALVPFELTTVLLLVAVVGALAVARTKPSKKKTPRIDNETLRMFHGPLGAATSAPSLVEASSARGELTRQDGKEKENGR